MSGAPPVPAAPPAPPAARILGWISLGMGLTLLAPGRAARLFGLGRAARLMAVIGVRDVVIGLGLLRGRRPAGWLRAQAAADAVDATIVGLALLGVGGHRGGPGHPGRRVDRARRPERPGAGETRTRCHRRLLKELLLAVARGRGLVVDPDTDELDRTLLEARRKAVLAAEGFPLICSVCGRPAGTARAIRGRDGYGYCSEACLEADVARWKAQLWSAGSGRRP